MENMTSGDTQLLDKGCGTYCGLSFLRWPLVLWGTPSSYPLFSRALSQVCKAWHNQDDPLAPTPKALFLPSVLAPWGQQEPSLLHLES